MTVVAQSLAFDTATIELEPVPSTITFENRDAGVQHNIAIYADSSLADELFNGELITRARDRRSTPSPRCRRASTTSSATSTRT